MNWLYIGDIMNKAEKQRDILFEACKEIATNKRTPEWISGILTQAVKTARQVKDDFWEEGIGDKKQETYKEPQVGLKGKIDMLDNTPYYVEILKEAEEVEGIKLFHIRILNGKGPHAIGSIVYNVPGNWIHSLEG